MSKHRKDDSDWEDHERVHKSINDDIKEFAHILKKLGLGMGNCVRSYHPDRNTIITEDEKVNLIIDLETLTVDEFIDTM